MSQETIIELLLFLIASYFLFYKSLLKSLGKEIAKLSTAKDLITIQESVKKNFNESLELYKSKLSAEVQAKIEPLKAELARQNLSHQIEFSFLHQERVRAIIVLYEKLQELYFAMNDWTNPIQFGAQNQKDYEIRIQRAENALSGFENYFRLNKIFFSEDFCESIEAVVQIYSVKGWDYSYSKSKTVENGVSDEDYKKYSMELTAISKELRELIPQRIAEIECLCRNILGTEENRNT